ncbi:MAG: hypothetical protein HXS44_04915 [Theionarchaea archaeon]|nr:hypothetical protein [Theionarchaea archaeon]
MIDQFALGILNAWLFWVLILFARYILLRIMSDEAYHRADHVPPLNPKEVIAYRIQSVSLFMSMILSVFIPLRTEQPFFVCGFAVFGIGYAGYIAAMKNFSETNNRIATKGLYKITRHPMYMSFFVIHIGIILATLSLSYFILIIIYQISTHWILIAEERSCLEMNEAYRDYMEGVHRYFGRSSQR